MAEETNEIEKAKKEIKAAFQPVLEDKTLREIFIRRTGSQPDDKGVEATRDAIIDRLLAKGAALKLQELYQKADKKPKTPDELYEATFKVFAEGKPLIVEDQKLRYAIAEIAATKYVQQKHPQWKPKEPDKYRNELINDELAPIKQNIRDEFDKVINNPTMREIFVRRTGSGGDDKSIKAKRDAIIDDMAQKGIDLAVGEAGSKKTADELYEAAYKKFSEDGVIKDKLLRNALAEVAAAKFVQAKFPDWKPKAQHEASQNALIDAEVAKKVDESIDQARDYAKGQVSGTVRRLAEAVPGVTRARKTLKLVGKENWVDDPINDAADTAVGLIKWDNLKATMRREFSALMKDKDFQKASSAEQKRRIKDTVRKALDKDFKDIFPVEIDLGGVPIPNPFGPDGRIDFGTIDICPDILKERIIDRITDEVGKKVGEQLSMDSPRNTGVEVTMDDVRPPPLPAGMMPRRYEMAYS